MKKSFMALSVFCMAVIIVLSACTNSTSIPRSDVTVTLNGSASTVSRKAMSSRTLLPEEMPTISTYTISIAQVNGEGVIPDTNKEFSFNDGNLTEFLLKDVPLGTYSIVVEGLDKNAKLVVRGTSDKNFEVTANGNNSVNVDLSLVSESLEENLKGFASMTFDWSAVVSNENIKKAMANGGLVFYLYYYDEQKNDWSEPVKSKATGSSATSYEFEAELPVSTGLRIKYALATNDGLMLNPTLTTAIAQIYSGLVSVQKGTEGSVYYITDNEISAATNVYNVTYEYGTGENRGTSIILKWDNQMQNGKSLFNKVVISYVSKGGQSGTLEVPITSGEASSSKEITNLVPGNLYTFTFTAYHTSGLVSPSYTYEKEIMPEVLVKAPVVTATPSGISINLSWDKVENAKTYTIERKINNGEFEVLKEDYTDTEYSDSTVESGKSYSYRVKAYGDSVESEYSNETEAIDISSSIVTITPPSGTDYQDFEITINADSDVLVVTKDNPLTFSVTDIPRVTEYTWLLNGEYAGTGKSITISTDNPLLDKNLVSVSDKLVLQITTASGKFGSQEIKFAVGEDAVDKGIKINYTGSTRLSSESKAGEQRTLDLSQFVTINGGANVIKEVSYKVSGGNESLATVNEKTGVITFANPTEETKDFSVTITATSFGGYSDSVTFDVYYVVVSDAKTLLDKINAVIKSLMIEADTEFGSDWWEFTVNDKQFTTIPKVTVQRNNATAAGKDHQLGYISFDSFSQNIENIGSVTLTGTVTIDSEENGRWGYAGDNRLNYFGNGNSGYDDTIYIELPYNQGEASIKYNKINVLTRSNSGTYQIEFDGYDRLDLTEKLDDNSQITSVIY